MCPKIILIDNDADTVDVLTILLQDAGCDVYSSPNDKILDNLNIIQPDIFLIDLWLAGSTVEELCRKLKSDTATQFIPVIIFSAANNLPESSRRCSAENFIAKPFDIDCLLKTIGSELAKVSNYLIPLIF